MMKTAFSYVDLQRYWRKGLRTGNWRKLWFLDKALFRAAMWYARYGRSIENGKLVEKHFFQKEIFTKETILCKISHLSPSLRRRNEWDTRIYSHGWESQKTQQSERGYYKNIFIRTNKEGL